MDLLDRLLGHDAWTTRLMLELCLPLSDEQLDRHFPIGPGSLRATFDHIVWNMEAWTDLMDGRPRRPHPGAGGMTVPRLVERLDAVAAELAAVARRVRDEGRDDDTFTDTVDVPPVRKRLGTAVAHVITHSMHHRAQVLNMMRHLGMKDLPEGDVFSWEDATRGKP